MQCRKISSGSGEGRGKYLTKDRLQPLGTQGGSAVQRNQDKSGTGTKQNLIRFLCDAGLRRKMDKKVINRPRTKIRVTESFYELLPPYMVQLDILTEIELDELGGLTFSIRAQFYTRYLEFF